MKVLLISILSFCYLNNVFSQIPDTTINICADETKEDYKHTIKLYLEKIEKDSMDLRTRYNLAMSYYRFADSLNFRKSIEQWDFIIRYDKCFNYALENRALCKLFLTDQEGFCEDIKTAKQCNYPDMSDIDNYLEEYCREK